MAPSIVAKPYHLYERCAQGVEVLSAQGIAFGARFE